MQRVGYVDQKAPVGSRIGLPAPLVAVIRLVAHDQEVLGYRPIQRGDEVRIQRRDGNITAIRIDRGSRPPAVLAVKRCRQPDHGLQVQVGAGGQKALPARGIEVVQADQLHHVTPLAHYPARVSQVLRPDRFRPVIAPIVEQQVHAQFIRGRGKRRGRACAGRGGGHGCRGDRGYLCGCGCRGGIDDRTPHQQQDKQDRQDQRGGSRHVLPFHQAVSARYRRSPARTV